MKSKTVAVTPGGHLISSETKEFRTTISLEPEDVERLEKLIAGYGELKPSYAQVFKMLIVDGLRKGGRSSGPGGQAR